MEYIHVTSAALHREVAVGVYLPPSYAATLEIRFPTLYFLHGMNGSDRQWEQRDLPNRVDALIAASKTVPMIVVTPDGDSSFYVRWSDGTQDWETFITNELVTAIDAKYRTIPTRPARGLSGDSMGGYGALNLAFRNPIVFGSVSAHSAALFPEDPAKAPDWMRRADAFHRIFGNPPDSEAWKANNPLHLAATLDLETLKTLEIYFDCGDADPYGFDAGAKALHDALERRDVRHEFHLRPGTHGRSYYTAHSEFSLGFHGRVFERLVCKAEPTKADKLQVAVTKNGFEPSELNVTMGKPVTLVFTRTTEDTCAKDLVILLGGDKTIEKPLPFNVGVEVTTVFQTRGDVSFACGIGKYVGHVAVH